LNFNTLGIKNLLTKIDSSNIINSINLIDNVYNKFLFNNNFNFLERIYYKFIDISRTNLNQINKQIKIIKIIIEKIYFLVFNENKTIIEISENYDDFIDSINIIAIVKLKIDNLINSKNLKNIDYNNTIEKILNEYPNELSEIFQIFNIDITSDFDLIFLKNNIINMINIYNEINGTIQGSYLANGSIEYSDSKAKYGTKIEVLNEIKREFDKIQNELNATIKDYNKYIKNFKNMRNYASFVIMVLIAVIIITILVTVLDSVTPNFKSHFYVIGFILLSFITFVYYNKFKYVNLYERFIAVANSDQFDTTATGLPLGTATPLINSQACISNTINITTEANNAPLRNTHKTFINSIASELNTYNNAISSLISGVSTNLYTSNYGVFTKDGNNYLYNLYVEKKSQNEANRIKKVALANMLDTMKRHIVYLFNVILLISLLTIVLLFGLILFSNFPLFLTPIITLCVILIIVIIVYFINSIVQPTRMLINKNYWANKNPSRLSIAKLA